LFEKESTKEKQILFNRSAEQKGYAPRFGLFYYGEARYDGAVSEQQDCCPAAIKQRCVFVSRVC
jgi:hypothetical protein